MGPRVFLLFPFVCIFLFLLFFPSREICTRSSGREVRIRVPTFAVVYLSRGTLPQKRGQKGTTGGHSVGTLDVYSKLPPGEICREHLFQMTREHAVAGYEIQFAPPKKPRLKP